MNEPEATIIARELLKNGYSAEAAQSLMTEKGFTREESRKGMSRAKKDPHMQRGLFKSLALAVLLLLLLIPLLFFIKG